MEIKNFEKSLQLAVDLKYRRITDRLIVHHSSSENDTKEIILDWHLNGRKWPHMGYHFIIDKEGIGWSCLPKQVEGIHAYGFNQRSIGICLIGNFNEHLPRKAQLESLSELCVSLVKEYDLRYWQIYGHGSQRLMKIFKTTRTACPGKYLQRELPNVRITAGIEANQITLHKWEKESIAREMKKC